MLVATIELVASFPATIAPAVILTAVIALVAILFAVIALVANLSSTIAPAAITSPCIALTAILAFVTASSASFNAVIVPSPITAATKVPLTELVNAECCPEWLIALTQK